MSALQKTLMLKTSVSLVTADKIGDSSLFKADHETFIQAIKAKKLTESC